MEEQKNLKKEYFSKLIQKNYDHLNKYYSHSFIEFCEMNSLKIEILNCQLFELFQASIFTTNHFVERMIKLALIKKHTIKFDYSDLRSYTQKLEESETEFDGLVLYKSLKKALENQLITKKQFEYLSSAKDEFRNPYSHAQISEVIKDDNDFTGFMFNINDVKDQMKKGEQISIPKPTTIPKFSPAIAQFLQENNAKEKAFIYFKDVFEVLIEIEERIIKLKNERH